MIGISAHWHMEEFDYENACVTLGNNLIMDLKLPVPRLQSIYQITSTFYAHLVAAVGGTWPIGVIRFPKTAFDDLHNIRLVLNLMENKHLNRKLPHINAENLIIPDAVSIFNLLEIFTKYLHLFPSPKNTVLTPIPPQGDSSTTYHVCPNGGKIDTKRVKETRDLHRMPRSQSTTSSSPYPSSDARDEIVEQSLSSSDSELPLELRFSPKQVRFQPSHHTRKIKSRNWKQSFVRAAQTYGFHVSQPKLDGKRRGNESGVDLVDYLKEELPEIRVPREETLWHDCRRRVVLKTKRDPVFEYLKNGVEKHEALRNHYLKQTEARCRKLKMDARKKNYHRINNILLDEKILNCNVKKLENEFRNRTKSNAFAIQNKEEILFNDVYSEGVAAQRAKLEQIIERRESERFAENETEMNEIISRFNAINDITVVEDFHFRQADGERIKDDLWKAKYIL